MFLTHLMQNRYPKFSKAKVLGGFSFFLSFYNFILFLYLYRKIKAQVNIKQKIIITHNISTGGNYCSYFDICTSQSEFDTCELDLHIFSYKN